MKKITIEWNDPTQPQVIFRCETVRYGPDARNAVLRGVDFPTRQPGMSKVPIMLIPLNNVRVLTEEEW